jgi:exodeoxyribonuclease VII small subunit
MAESKSFKNEIENLERIVRSLENEDLDLDEALKLFGEGVERLKGARALLKDADATIKKVIEAEDGTLRTEDADI